MHAVKARIVVVAARRAASGDPDHDGRVLRVLGRPEVEHEGVAAADHGGRLAVGLQRDGARLRRVEDAFPGLGLHGREKAAFGHIRILSEGKAPEDADAVLLQAAHASEGRRNLRCRAFRCSARTGVQHAGGRKGGKRRARFHEKVASGDGVHE